MSTEVGFGPSSARSAPATAAVDSPSKSPDTGALRKSVTSSAGGHIGTMKSMALLHELQEYMLSTQYQKENAKAELDQLRREKQRLEKEIRKSTEPPKATMGKHDDVVFGDGQDLPPRLRAVLEDNRMLKEQGRRQKQQLRDYEATISAQNDQVLRLQDELKKLRALTKGSGNDEKTQQELQHARDQISSRDSKIRDLASRLDILEKARAADLKKAKGQVAQAMRERDQAGVEMRMAQEFAEDKDKELRRTVLKVRELQKQLDPLKDLQAMQRKAAEDEKRLSALKIEVDEKIKVLEEPRVFVMLCLIHGEGGGKKKPKVGADSSVKELAHELTEEEAAVVIQAHYKGYKTRAVMRQIKPGGAPSVVKLEAGSAEAPLDPGEGRPPPEGEPAEASGGGEGPGAVEAEAAAAAPAAASEAEPEAAEAARPDAAGPDASDAAPKPGGSAASSLDAKKKATARGSTGPVTPGAAKGKGKKGEAADDGEVETVVKKVHGGRGGDPAGGRR